MFVKMQKGDLVTHVYNDPETIADAEKKGFRPVDAAAAEPVGETDAAADATAQDAETPEPADGLLPDETLPNADAAEAGSRNGGSRRKASG